MTPPLVMNWKMLINLVASIGTPMKKRGNGHLFLVDRVNHIRRYLDYQNVPAHRIRAVCGVRVKPGG